MSKMSALAAARDGYEATAHSAARNSIIAMMHAEAVQADPAMTMKAKAPSMN